MPVELKDIAVIGANPLEDAVAVEQAVIEDANFCFFFGDELTVEVDLHSSPPSPAFTLKHKGKKINLARLSPFLYDAMSRIIS